MKVCFVGHVTRDVIRRRGSPDTVQPGGSAWYGAHVAVALGSEVRVVTRMGPHDGPSVESQLRKLGVQVDVFESAFTTSFVNAYPDEGQEDRIQSIEAVADPFELAHLGPPEDGFLFGPLTRDDMPLELLLRASATSTVALDIQGLLRMAGERQVRLGTRSDLPAFVGAVDIVKAGVEEACLASGASDIRETARWFLAAGAAEVLITRGSAGSVVATADGIIDVPAYHFGRTVDTTGCGDVYLAAYMVKRIAGQTVSEAAQTASAAAGLSATFAGAPPIADVNVETAVRRRLATRSGSGR